MAAVAKVLALFLFLILPALVAFLAADHSRDQPLLALPAAAPLEHTIDSSRVVPPAAASHAHPLVAVAGTASRDSSRVVPPAAASHDHPPVAVTGTTSHDSSRIVPPAAASHDHPLVVRAASPHGHPPRRLADREPSSEHDGGIRFAGFTYWIAGFAVAAAGVATKLIDGFAVAAVGMAAKWMGGFAIAIGVSVGVVLINHFFSYPHFARHRRAERPEWPEV
uniref:Uncharacterized protein n=1 Tax=Leersia perrieri TaxID=77586 RepID=A0A0D9XKT1_9ORYZ